MKQTKSGAKRLHKRQVSTLVRCPLNVIADYKFYDALTSGDTTLRIAQATSLIRTFVSDVSNQTIKRPVTTHTYISSDT